MRVLVTRPEPGAARTARQLSDMGHDAVVLPLSQIVPVTPNPVPSTKGFLGVVFSSANAIAHLPVTLHRRVSRLPCHVVGQRTADEAIANGFDVRTVAADSENLIDTLAEHYEPGASLAFISGRVRTAGIEQGFDRLGLDITVIEVYDTLQFSYSTDYIIERLGSKPIDAILVLSVVAARQVQDLMTRDRISEYLKESKVYCISDRVAIGFAGMKSREVLIAPTPNEAGVLRLLDTQ